MFYSEIVINYCGKDDIASILKEERFKSFFPEMPEIKRAYIGSEFCSYFLRLFQNKIDNLICKLIDQVENITIVFPNILESDFKILKEIIEQISCINVIDEIVVNDFGSLKYLSEKNLQKNIVLGRLFTKNSRDPRIDLWNHEPIKEKLVLTDLVQETPLYKALLKKNKIMRIETDYINHSYAENLPNDILISVHYPYTYVTSGNVCAVGSILKPSPEKFKLENKCFFDCTRYFGIVENESLINRVINIGNSYLYEASDDVFYNDTNSNIRIVYYPQLVCHGRIFK